MKKLVYIIASVIFLHVVACDDNWMDAYGKHTYTDAEQAYADSVRNAQEAEKGQTAEPDYTQIVPLTMESESDWSSVAVGIDIALMCEKLGYADEAALVAAIGNMSETSELQLTAYNPADKSEYTAHVVDSEGEQEGFTFDANGVPDDHWGDADLFWAVYNTTEKTFYVGKKSGAQDSGTYTHTVMWKKRTYRFAMQFVATIPNPAPTFGNITLTRDVALVSASLSETAGTVFTIDYTEMANALRYNNVDELQAALGHIEYNVQVDNEVDVVAINLTQAMEYSGSFTAANCGFWFTATGDVCSYKDEEAAIRVEFDPESMEFTIGQKPNAVTDGGTYRAVLVFAANENRVAVELNIQTIVDTPPPGSPYNKTVERTINHIMTGTWDWGTPIDITDDLRDAFKKTTAEIKSAIASKVMTFYALTAGSEEQIASTSNGGDYPGHWWNVDGTVATNWSDGELFIKLDTVDRLQFIFQNNPGNLTAPAEIIVTEVAEMNGGKVTFIFHFNLVAAQ